MTTNSKHKPLCPPAILLCRNSLRFRVGTWCSLPWRWPSWLVTADRCLRPQPAGRYPRGFSEHDRYETDAPIRIYNIQRRWCVSLHTTSINKHWRRTCPIWKLNLKEGRSKSWEFPSAQSHTQIFKHEIRCSGSLNKISWKVGNLFLTEQKCGLFLIFFSYIVDGYDIKT